jgi:uncharacterized membrane protein YkvA (DUF1232 family)
MFGWLSLPREEIEKIVRMVRNPNAPKGPKFIVAALFLYIIWPLDLLPDFVVPVLGWADDLGFFGLTLWWLHKEVERLSR